MIAADLEKNLTIRIFDQWQKPSFRVDLQQLGTLAGIAFSKLPTQRKAELCRDWVDRSFLAGYKPNYQGPLSN